MDRERVNAPTYGTLESLFANVGRSGFHAALSRLANEVTGADHCGAFQMIEGAPACVAVGSVIDAGIPMLAAKRYLSRHWRSDRAWTAARENVQPLVHRTRTCEIPEHSYRRECFDTSGVADKMSVLRSSRHGSLCVSVFRSRQEFSDAAVLGLTRAANLLLNAVERHADLTLLQRPAGSRLISKQEAVEMLGAVCAELTMREREVCGRILAGMSSEAIALDLSLQFGSILTYRKRAYARLGITSQAELFAICLRAARRSGEEVAAA